jgi:hypothetical protein
MKTRFLVLFACIGLAVASASSYRVNLYQPVMLGSTELAPGEYKVEVVGDKAVIRNGRVDAQAPVKVETTPSKISATSTKLTMDGGKAKLAEISIGGTNTKLVFE